MHKQNGKIRNALEENSFVPYMIYQNLPLTATDGITFNHPLSAGYGYLLRTAVIKYSEFLSTGHAAYDGALNISFIGVARTGQQKQIIPIPVRDISPSGITRYNPDGTMNNPAIRLKKVYLLNFLYENNDVIKIKINADDTQIYGFNVNVDVLLFGYQVPANYFSKE